MPARRSRRGETILDRMGFDTLRYERVGRRTRKPKAERALAEPLSRRGSFHEPPRIMRASYTQGQSNAVGDP